MTPERHPGSPDAGRRAARAIALSLLTLIGCASTRAGTVARPEPDPRVGLAAGRTDAGTAAWNLRLLSTRPPAQPFDDPLVPDNRYTNSDLAFFDDVVVQGNYSGYQFWDISEPGEPTLIGAYVCPGSQNDVSVYGNLLFASGESTSGRVDCGTQGVADSVSPDRMRGIRIFDIDDPARPRPIANVQTCRGSHTHTLVTDPDDPENVYIYVSGSAPVRSPLELPGCSGAPPEEDPESVLFRIEVIRVPLDAPDQARIVSSPRILAGLEPAVEHGELLADSLAALEQMAAAGVTPPDGPPPPPTGPVQCHDITVYTAIGLGGGACGGYGVLLDVSDVANPKRIAAAADPNFAFWHSATFNNDGDQVLFTDEWGGGTQPRCRATDRPEWGANAIFTIADRDLAFESYYKLPAAQTPQENCVAHNGSLIPIPDRDVMVQGWYQGGISVFDWTDPENPVEIAYFDRGPVEPTTLVNGGSWSAYWYNGVIVSSEIARGLDVLELVPSEYLSQNEIDAAKTVRLDVLNVQNQPRFVWPPSFALARAYLDQLDRSRGLEPERVAALRAELDAAERLSGPQRREALSQLAVRLDAEVLRAADQEKVRKLARALRELAQAEG